MIASVIDVVPVAPVSTDAGSTSPSEGREGESFQSTLQRATPATTSDGTTTPHQASPTAKSKTAEKPTSAKATTDHPAPCAEQECAEHDEPASNDEQALVGPVVSYALAAITVPVLDETSQGVEAAVDPILSLETNPKPTGPVTLDASTPVVEAAVDPIVPLKPTPTQDDTSALDTSFEGEQIVTSELPVDVVQTIVPEPAAVAPTQPQTSETLTTFTPETSVTNEPTVEIVAAGDVQSRPESSREEPLIGEEEAPVIQATSAEAVIAPETPIVEPTDGTSSEASSATSPTPIAGPGADTIVAPIADGASTTTAERRSTKHTVATTSTETPAQITPPPAPAPGSSVPLDTHVRHLQPAGEAGLTEVERVRFIQRVARAVQGAQESDGVVRLRLSPPELGALRVEMRVDGGQLTARIEAETQQTRQLLLDNLPSLRERLEQQDIKITRFDVDLFSNTTGNPSHGAGQQSADERSGLRVQARRTSNVDADATPTPLTRSTIAGDGRLNIVI